MSPPSHSEASSSTCCETASAQLKIYQAFIFSVPIFFAFVLLLLFYLFYLRRRRVDWSSLRMRTSHHLNDDNISICEMGLKKEVREMLPIIVFKESFSVRDPNCSVCLGEYQAEDKLQQIPACKHTFHMECIDHWLACHTTCPLCRLSLIPPPIKPAAYSVEPPSSPPPPPPPPPENNNDQTSRLQIAPQQQPQQIPERLSEPTNSNERRSGVVLVEEPNTSNDVNEEEERHSGGEEEDERVSEGGGVDTNTTYTRNGTDEDVEKQC